MLTHLRKWKPGSDKLSWIPPKNRAVASETVAAQDIRAATMIEPVLSTRSRSAAEGKDEAAPLLSGSLARLFGDEREAAHQSSPRR